MRYRAFGQVIESEEPLPELPLAPGSDAARFTIRLRDVTFPAGLRWSIVWPAAGGEPELSFARGKDAVFLRMADALSVAISDRRIEFAADPAADAAATRHVLLDQVLPLALAAAGDTVLHASAVSVDDTGVLFVGEAGSGKSTTAAALAACGAAVLADDGILLEARGREIWVVPSYPGLRLWPDGAALASARAFTIAPLSEGTAKRRLLPAGGHACPPALPLGRVYSLRVNGGPDAFTRLSRRDAALELVRHAFTPDLETRAAILAHLDRAAAWAACVEVWSVAPSRDPGALEPFARAILAHVRSGRASARLQDR